MGVDVKPGKLFIGGTWQDSVSGREFDTVNPATEEVITQVAEGDEQDVDLAVQAARRAFEEGPWSSMTAMEKGKLLWKVGELIFQKADELALLETMDTGKTLFESRNIDIPMAADCFRYYAGWATKIHGETIPVRGNYLNYTLREPLGVVGAIVPWNFPLLMGCFKVAPALAVGNTVILKPSRHTPLTAIKLAEICQEAEIPEGVINVVTGFGSTVGMALVRHPEVDKISLTGESTTGKEVMREAAGTLKKVTLELGGKSPDIVFADADLDAAARGTITGMFYNKGEVCAAGSRLLVEDSVHDQFMEKVIDRARRFTPGDPLDSKTRLGPIASAEQLDKVLRYIELGKGEGARLVVGGDRPSIPKGYFVNATVFDEVDNKARIAQEEIFGPVLAVIRFQDVDDAIKKANDISYGLAAGIWTRDIKKAHLVARSLKAGTVWINLYNMMDVASPFGGYKISGFGRELGMHALEHYTQVKSVWVNLGD